MTFLRYIMASVPTWESGESYSKVSLFKVSSVIHSHPIGGGVTLTGVEYRVSLEELVDILERCRTRPSLG